MIKVFILMAIFAFSSAVFANGTGSACIELFIETKQLPKGTTVERRNSDRPFTYTPSQKSSQQTMESTMLPDRTQIIMSYEKHVYFKNGHDYEDHNLRTYQETLVIVNGQLKVFREEIPMDPQLPFVINANLDKGRRLYDRSLEEGQGVVLFIDINDLGWINKNFKNAEKDGDYFVQAVSKAIQEVSSKNGLVFRLGGDEFGILMPMMKPEQINQILKLVQAKTKEYAEAIFRKEQDLRWQTYQAAKALREVINSLPQNYSESQKAEAEAQFITARENMKTFLHYSQPNIAIGATYYGGRSAEIIQHEVEQNAHPHKMAIKKSNHASIAKYVSDPDEIDYIKGPLFVVDYEFPLLEDRTAMTPPQRAPVNFNKPQVSWNRERVLYHIGHYNIAQYKSENGVYELKVETWKDGKLYDLADLPIHKHTQLIDVQAVIAKDLLAETQNSPFYNGLFIDLLNLGKMNYFKNKSKTGDIALARVAKIMRDFFNKEAALVRKKRIGYKLRGSEFMFFIEGYPPSEFIPTLMMLINSDPVIKKIYRDQLDYLISQSTSGTENSAKIEELRKMMDGPFVKIEAR